MQRNGRGGGEKKTLGPQASHEESKTVTRSETMKVLRDDMNNTIEVGRRCALHTRLVNPRALEPRHWLPFIFHLLFFFPHIYISNGVSCHNAACLSKRDATRPHYVEEVSRVAREAKLRLENLDEAGDRPLALPFVYS